MTLKYINFSVDMYGTSAITANTYQTVFTGDEDSVQLKFSVTDEEDLTGATALIHLYFGDSSHIERVCTPITGGFQYTLTGTENDHAGITRVDIYITKAGAKFTRAGYKFRIDKSLEASAPLVEYAVDTVDTIVKEAGDWLLQAQTDFGTSQGTRAAEWVADNDTRADDFNAAQTSRANSFSASEAARTSTFNANETGRSNTFTVNENARQEAAEANQAQAATDHSIASADHDTAVADSSLASSDHATATTDHSTAVTDHSTASADHAAALADQEIVDGLQDQFNDVIANATVDSEVINARQGSATLGQNILSMKEQLEHKADQAQADNLQGQVTALVLGAVGAGNNAEVIQARVDAKGAVFPTVKGHLDNIESFLQTGQTLLAFSDWVVGAVDSGTGANSVSTTRIRTDTHKQMPVGKTVNVKVTAGYRVYVLYYNEALAYVGNGGWKTTDFILDTSFANYKFMISAVTEATATIALADFIKMSYSLPIFLNDESVTGAKLVDKSISAEKTTFLNPVYDGNLFDKDNLISGYYLNYQTGIPTVNASYSYTKEWRECVEGATYSITSGEWQIVYGDANKLFTSGELINGTSFVPPAGAKYFRISVQTAIKDTTMVVKGATLPVTYVAYSKAFAPTVFLRNAKPKIIEVTKDLWGNFQDPAKAIASANEKDTIIIYPGEFESYIDTRNKEISIIGVNKKNCIIYGTSPDYVSPPLEISKGYIANLTIHARKLEGAVATGATPYAIHPDWDYQANGKLEIFNCELISDWNAAIGAGLKSGFTLHLRDTDLITNEPTNTNGALYFHDSDSPATYGDSFLVVDNCNLKSKSAIAIMPASLGIVDNAVFMTFLRTMMYSDINGKTNDAVGVGRPVTGTGWRTYNNFFLTPDSFGNNQALFNVV